MGFYVFELDYIILLISEESLTFGLLIFFRLYTGWGHLKVKLMYSICLSMIPKHSCV